MNISMRSWGRLAVMLCLAMPLAAQAKPENPDEVLTAAKLPTQFWVKLAYSEGDTWTVYGYKAPTASPGGNCVSAWTIWEFHYVRGSGKASLNHKRSGHSGYFNPGKGAPACGSVDVKQLSDIEDQDVDVIAHWLTDLKAAVPCVQQKKYEHCGPWKSIDMVFVNVEPTPELEAKYQQNFITLPQRPLHFAMSRDDGGVDMQFEALGKTDSGVGCTVKRLKDGSETLEYGVY